MSLIRPTPDLNWFNVLPNAVIITEQRVQFKIEKTLGKEPNKCEVTVTNLAPTTRADVERKPLLVRLEVGYESIDNVEQIFAGDCRKASTARSGVDWNTKFLLGDGDRAFQFARTSRSFSPNTKVGTIVNEIVGDLKLPLPKGVKDALEFQKSMVGGYTAHGPSERELTNILTPLGMSWSMQDGQLQILREAEAAPGSAFVISQDTGMIGSPEYGDPKKQGGNPILKVKTQIYPKLVCGGLISVQSRDIKGIFRIEQLTHTGDTHAPSWETEIEAMQV